MDRDEIVRSFDVNSMDDIISHLDTDAWFAETTKATKPGKRLVDIVKQSFNADALDEETKENLVNILNKPLNDVDWEFAEVLNKIIGVPFKILARKRLYMVMKEIMETGGRFEDLVMYLDKGQSD